VESVTVKKIERSEVLPLGEYEAIRERFRARVIAEKKLRRVRLHEDVSLVFENHDTMLMQVQEMLRTERISAERGIAHEIETYNELVPDAHELSATLFIEIPDRQRREEMLERLCAIEEHVVLSVDGHTVRATFEEGRRDQGRAAAVQYLKFPLTPEVEAGLLAGKAAVLSLDHPHLQAKVDLAKDTIRSLADDLT
jgi:Protein of unknown function (DUF3501)